MVQIGLIWDKKFKIAFNVHNNLSVMLNMRWAYLNADWNGMIQHNMHNKEYRIHPTQKPVALYKWLLKNYAKPNDKIFDSHVGSGSIRIACHDIWDFTGCEIDKDYWEAQEERYKTHVSQQDLFTPEVMQDTIYQKELL